MDSEHVDEKLPSSSESPDNSGDETGGVPTLPVNPVDVEIAEPKIARCARFGMFIRGLSASIYVSHFLSAWGDRMWQFAVGMYLNDLSPNNLRLVASFGFSLGTAGVLMGAIIGHIVDKHPRLMIARTVLACQNILVAACAILVCMVYQYKDFIYSKPWLSGLCEAGIIILAVLANLFSTALKISVTKDWISVICEGKSARLARLSAAMRAIDQVANTAAPILTGLLMSYGSIVISAIFVAVWNICSVFIEYGLLLRIYNKVPELAIKMPRQLEAERTDDVEDVAGSDSLDASDIPAGDEQEAGGVPIKDQTSQDSIDENSLEREKDDAAVGFEMDTEKDSGSLIQPKKARWSAFIGRLFSVFITLKTGWSIYFSYDVKFAGLGLALVFMTVLGFDNITTGYALHQGASEALIGGLMSVSAIIGISATISYPFLREKVGIERTGLIGFWAQIICLSLCVVSVWAPGSPFDLTSQPTNASFLADMNGTLNLSSVSQVPESTEQTHENYTSLALLMAGMIAARFGLWTLDLSINQLLLERVDVSQRGVVNGVQGSMNMIMDMLKFILVIAVPLPRHFGLLIIFSFLAVCSGAVSYSVYSYRKRGHLFHFEKLLFWRRKANVGGLELVKENS